MILTKEVKCDILVKATLTDEGELKLGLSATVPYGKRSATATLVDFPEELLERVKEVLQDVIDTNAKRIIGQAEDAANRSRIVAINLGEEV